jgi:hypothetical protein
MSEEKWVIAVLILITVAILGFVLGGHGSSSSAAPEATREVANPATTLTYPSASGWRRAYVEPSIPGLSIAQPLILAPKGNAGQSGLIVGQLLGSASSPLPPTFLQGLHESPAAAVVGLANTQAYRYSQLSIVGSNLKMTIFTVPTSASATTAIVCYATSGSSSLPACEQLAATLSIATGKPEVQVRSFEPLTPSADYARHIKAIVTGVNQLLGTLRPQMLPGAPRATASSLAERLSDGLAGAAGSLAALAPPPAVARAQAALVEYLTRAHVAYAALGGALLAGNTSGYDTARSQIYAAEAGLTTAVKSITLLGYQ